MSSSGKDPRRSRMDGDLKATLGTLLELQRCNNQSLAPAGTCLFPKKRPFCANFFLETTLFPLRLIEALVNSMSIHASPDGLWLRAGTALSSQMR